MDLKKSLIGNVKKCIADTNFNLDSPEVQAKLAKPLKWEGAVTRMVCTKCGEISEINQTVVIRLFRFMNLLSAKPEIVFNESLKNWHFEINYCHSCKKTSMRGEVKLVRNKGA
jgi:hypothetical protein